MAVGMNTITIPQGNKVELESSPPHVQEEAATRILEVRTLQVLAAKTLAVNHARITKVKVGRKVGMGMLFATSLRDTTENQLLYLLR